MNVYKLIQELTRFDPDQEVKLDSDYTNVPIKRLDEYDGEVIIS